MGYKPTRFDDSVNVENKHPLRDLFELVVGLLLFLILIYLLLGWIVNWSVGYVSVENEKKLFSFLEAENMAGKRGDEALEAELQALFDSLPDHLKPKGYDYRLLLIENHQPNAFAMPGGYIAVTTGLLRLLSSENALVFVIGHELGHFENRDHLRRLGRVLPMMIITGMMGLSDTVWALSSKVEGLMENHYSREAEHSADVVGLKMLVAHYGHAGGAAEFFDKLKARGQESELDRYISTHPMHQDRIIALEQAIMEMDAEMRDVLPLTIKPKGKGLDALKAR